MTCPVDRSDTNGTGTIQCDEHVAVKVDVWSTLTLRVTEEKRGARETDDKERIPVNEVYVDCIFDVLNLCIIAILSRAICHL